jgi:hypothetical protein
MQILGMAIRNVHSWEAAVDVLANDRLAPIVLKNSTVEAEGDR